MGGAGPSLTHILERVLSMADLGSPQPQVFVSALSSKPQWRRVGWGGRSRLLLWRQLGWGGGEGGSASIPGAVDPGGVLEPSRGWGLSGEMGRVRQPQTRLHSFPTWPAGVCGLSRGGGGRVRMPQGCLWRLSGRPEMAEVLIYRHKEAELEGPPGNVPLTLRPQGVGDA